MSRLPIRIRLTAIFAVAMAAVLAVVGAVLYVRLAASLDEQINDRLDARSASVAESLRRGDQSALSEAGAIAVDGFAQLLAADGRVVGASPGFADRSLLTSAEIAAISPGGTTLDRVVREPDGDVEPARLRATHVTRDAARLILVVGESQGDRQDALSGLVTQLWLLGPIALTVSAILGYLVSRAALQPVEAMRVRAATIDPDSPERMLPLPVSRDEIHRLGETLNAMLARLDEGLERERRFTADASHELRTPLSLLKTELELATRRPRSPAELMAALRSASEEVDRLVRLADNLLVLSAADENRMPLERSTFPVQEAMETVVGRFAAAARAAGRTLDVAAGGPTVRADRARLEQALGNLVDNALCHGGGRVRLEAGREDRVAVVRVTDEGAGFPEDFLPTAFDRFTRADASRSGASAGLGLAIVQAVAQAHGGDVTAANEPSGGAVITLRLPASD